MAVEAAHAAGQVLLRHFSAGVTPRWKAERDPVTDADEEAQQAVRRQLLAAFPDDLVVGEEGPSMPEAQVQGRRRWYVDPLDGTTNFLRRRRRWATSVALCDPDDRMVAAAVHIPCWNETYTARVDRGAYRGHEPLRASTVDRTDQVLLALGAVGVDQPAPRAAVGRLAGRVLSVRVTGSTVCDLCDLAGGRADAFWANAAGRWDLAAGALIASEAGARVTDLSGRRVEGPAEVMLGAAPAVHDELLALVRGDG